MIYYLKKYPLATIIIVIICYLSFFTPPQTELSEVTNIDKIVHFLMYGGLSIVLWYEYLRIHKVIRWKHIIIGAIIAPILMSGSIELMQANLTKNRSGEWTDFISNIIGVLVAAIVGYYILRPLIHVKGK